MNSSTIIIPSGFSWNIKFPYPIYAKVGGYQIFWRKSFITGPCECTEGKIAVWYTVKQWLKDLF